MSSAAWCLWESWSKCTKDHCLKNNVRFRRRDCGCPQKLTTCAGASVSLSSCKYSIECQQISTFQIMGMNYYYFLLLLFLIVVGLTTFVYCCRYLCLRKMQQRHSRSRSSRRTIVPVTVPPRMHRPPRPVDNHSRIDQHDIPASSITSYPMWGFVPPPAYTERLEDAAGASEWKLPTYDEAMAAQLAADAAVAQHQQHPEPTTHIPIPPEPVGTTVET